MYLWFFWPLGASVVNNSNVFLFDEVRRFSMVMVCIRNFWSFAAAGRSLLLYGKMSANANVFPSFNIAGFKAATRASSDMTAFRAEFAKSKHVVVLTGAGVSAESGVPTFRGAGGFWRKWQATELATPEAFARNPSLVWEFYHYRREVMLSKQPNAAHIAISECEKRLTKEGRRLVVITQNIDELHARAGSTNVIELHGSLFKVRCTKCDTVTMNKDSPICAALKDKGAPDPEAADARIPVDQLPRCKEEGCGGLLRPHVVWFGEALETDVLDRTNDELSKCDICLVIGTSSVVYPAAMFAPELAMRGITVAEFNMEETPATQSFGYHFQGLCGSTLPQALAP